MTLSPPEHFKGKSVADHLREARKRGALAMAETHGIELPGHLFAFADSAKDTATCLLILLALGLSPPLLLAFAFGFTIWKTGRSAFLGWSRLERLHRVIEEERWEIEHHREQEKSELREMYEAKGLSGKLLDEVVEVLMADDNRLLQVMLEEELGLTLEVYEHPLKQSLGACLGSLITSFLTLLAIYFLTPLIAMLTPLLVIAIASSMGARFEKRKKVQSVIWNLSLALFAGGAVYLLAKLL